LIVNCQLSIVNGPLGDLKAGVSRIRNRVIVRVLRELGLVEEWGTGYRRVTQACEQGGYPLFFDFQGGEKRIVSIEEVKKRDSHTY